MERLDYARLSAPAMQALFAFQKAVNGLTLDPVLKQLITVRASQLNGCIVCVDMHVKEARLHGERELRLHHLVAWRESPLFTGKEKAALAWAELVTQLPAHGISDEAYQAALQYFSEKELADLTFAVTTINTWNRLGVAFRTKVGKYDEMLGLHKAGLE